MTKTPQFDKALEKFWISLSRTSGHASNAVRFLMSSTKTLSFTKNCGRRRRNYARFAGKKGGWLI